MALQFQCLNLPPTIHHKEMVSDVTVSDALASDHLPISFHILDHVRARDILATVETDMDWEWFHSQASELISS